MELTGAIEALRATPEGTAIILHSDSRYVVDGIATWLPAWKARGWRTANKKPVKNEDLWRALEALAGRRSVTWVWVKGHAGHAENERVDGLADAEAMEAAAETGWRARTPGERLGFRSVA